jgi:Ca2+-binding EF-hand superfamily protein
LRNYVRTKFNEIDEDGNGLIDYEEFKKAVLSNKLQMNIAIGI